MSRLLVVVPTYARPLPTVMRCLASVERALPSDRLGSVVVVDQNPAPLALPGSVRHLRAEPGYPGPRRHLGAEAAAANADADDVFLFLDDDIVLTDWRRAGVVLNDLIRARPQTGCVQVASRWWQREGPIELGDTAGGILVRVRTYFEIGGYGEDYLDDLELFARALLHGRRNWCTRRVRSRHHYGAGGLKEYVGVSRAGRAHLCRSMLEQRYEGYLVRDWRPWGTYRFAAAPGSVKVPRVRGAA